MGREHRNARKPHSDDGCAQCGEVATDAHHCSGEPHALELEQVHNDNGDDDCGESPCCCQNCCDAFYDGYHHDIYFDESDHCLQRDHASAQADAKR